MKKTFMILLISALALIAVFRTEFESAVFGSNEVQEAPVEINTSFSSDLLESNISFTEDEIFWLNSHDYQHLLNLSKDDERLRVKAFIHIQQQDEADLQKYIDSLKQAYPVLKDKDLTSLPGHPVQLAK